jgi:hypothetical protein
VTCALCGGSPESVVTASWILVIDREAPSQNVLASNTGPSRWRYKRERNAWLLLLRSAKATLGVPDAKSKRRVIIERFYSGRQRQYDHANLVGGCKAAVDAMVLAGLLVDDSPHWAEIYYRQSRVGNGRDTAVVIQEVA